MKNQGVTRGSHCPLPSLSSHLHPHLCVPIYGFQGTRSSKKKKVAKLKRVMATVKKAAKRADGTGVAGHESSFAAIHLLHDPQTWVERLFARLQGGSDKWDTRLAVISVVSRVVGVHK